ncbi:MAG: phosphoribosyltransferase [Blastocatellia bacterium]|nr:phosphoribosyltransferase [Blastocatellia bacterium]
MQIRFRDRIEAGRLLAEKLGEYANRSDVIVLALPRGGVPVGFEVAQALKAPLDVLIVRKLGVPEQPELAMGAIASGGIRVLNDDLLRHYPIPADVIDSITKVEREELERRERIYRGDRPLSNVEGRTVILVDDGIATGTTMRSAVESLKRRNAAEIVIAVPVAPATIFEEFHRVKNHLVITCLWTPEPFIAVGLWYDQFPQLSDEEVRELLNRPTRYRVVERVDS